MKVFKDFFSRKHPTIRKRKSGQLTAFERDPELQRFTEELLATDATFTEITEKCRSYFGEDRAPSRSAIGRFYQKKIR